MLRFFVIGSPHTGTNCDRTNPYGPKDPPLSSSLKHYTLCFALALPASANCGTQNANGPSDPFSTSLKHVVCVSHFSRQPPLPTTRETAGEALRCATR